MRRYVAAMAFVLANLDNRAMASAEIRQQAQREPVWGWIKGERSQRDPGAQATHLRSHWRQSSNGRGRGPGAAHEPRRRGAPVRAGGVPVSWPSDGPSWGRAGAQYAERVGPRFSRTGAALRLRLERDARAPSLARAAVRGFGDECDIAAPDVDTLALLVSELVSNAVLHSDAPPASTILVRARALEQGTVRVEVIDAGSGFDAARRDTVGSSGGYGLFLVDDQASRWGLDHEAGTRVWFELETSVAGSA
jgi:anti-sigma regulatory factor (Ser/Thr protein kinase)